MKDTLDFKLVDAFAMSPYTGNVAGVIPHAEGLTDRQMQLIAAEFNAGATAFILPPTTAEADLRLRWFSPGTELTICGHATLAGVHTLLEVGAIDGLLRERGGVLRIEAKVGILRVEIADRGAEPRTIWIHMPDPRPKSKHVPLPPLLQRLGLGMGALDPKLPPIRTRDDDIILGVKTLQSLLELSPASAELGRFCMLEHLRGIFVTTTNALSRATVVQSRFFCPAEGIDEDPVSGSVHGPLGHHLVECGIVPLIDGKAEFLCAQGKSGGRSGVVRVRVEQAADGAKSVTVGGSCVTIATGRLDRLPIER